LDGTVHNEHVAENPYFFRENSEGLSWGECAAEIGRILYQAGQVADPMLKTIPGKPW
jgi:hypothetical protein